MYPVAPPVGTTSLPDKATYWMPADDVDPDDPDYEAERPGIGCFHDSWRITGATVDEAEENLDSERRMADAISQLARDAAHFDRLAYAIEGGNVGAPDEGLTDAEQEALGDFAWDIPPDLGALEIGVVGLTYALNAVGMVTAASCRGHAGTHAWSSAPVVSFAATETLARALQPLVAQAGCTFFVDDVRPDLLVVNGRSIIDTMTLAQAVIDNRACFG